MKNQKGQYQTITREGIDFRFLIVPTTLESGTKVFVWTLENPYGEGTLEENTSWSGELEADIQAAAAAAARRLNADR
tara:strand:- start:440 stop:670 length:231 start_codon:yes stop_codon:yes gene_type:complete